PGRSNRQGGGQPARSGVLPSSHCSPGSRKPFPQIEAFFPRTDQRFVSTPPGGSPGPSTRKKFVPHGLPVTVCNTAGSPMNPAGGAGSVASHTSQLLIQENGASGVVKALSPAGPQVGGFERRQSSVKLMLRRPATAAVKVCTPKGCVILYVPAAGVSIRKRTRLNTTWSPGTTVPARVPKRPVTANTAMRWPPPGIGTVAVTNV